MSKTVRVTTLVENTAGGANMLGEWGLSLWIETPSHRILFDTGAGRVLLPNAEAAGVPLAQADSIALSHGHYDHTGALADVLAMTDRPRVFAHPAALEPKYARGPGGAVRQIGLPEPLDERAIRDRAGELIFTEAPTAIGDGLWLTGQVPRVTEFEDVGTKFFLDPQCSRADLLLDDQGLFFESAAGTVVIVGCAHSGIINILRYVQELTDSAPIDAVMGGMHLGGASPERIARTIEAFEQMGVARVGPVHCTGMRAVTEMWHAYRGRIVDLRLGNTLEFPLK